MKSLLVQAPFRDTFGYSMPPPGLLRLGGELSRAGFEVELEDLAFRMARGELANGSLMCESAARLLLRRGDHDLIGFSVMGATLPAALEIARRLRELRPELHLLLGGPGLTGCSETVLERFPWIDAVVRGEAELSLPEVLGRLDEGRDLAGVLGVSWRDSEGQVVREGDRPMLAELSDLAPYAWELLPPLIQYKDINGELEGLTPIDSGRGCVYDCSFCTIGRYWSRRSRTLPADRLVREIHGLDHIEGARNAYLCHDIFGADREQAVEFCEAMIREGVRPWECRARVDHLDEALLQLMGRAGCYRVLLGVESGAGRVRELANKKQALDLDVVRTVADCGRAGIRPILSLILGLPGEGEGELEQSLELLVRSALTTDVVISLHLPNPQPGCGLTESHGEGARPLEGIPPDMAFGAGETAPERALIEAHPDLFSSWSLLADDPEHLRQLAAIAEAFPVILANYPRSWELVRRRLGLGHHELLKRARTSTEGFLALAREVQDPLIADALAWEEGLRELDGAMPRYVPLEMPASKSPQKSELQDAVECPGTLLRLDHDLPSIVAAMAAGQSQLPEAQMPTQLVLTPFPGGVRTSKVSSDVMRTLELIPEARSIAELEAQYPGITPTLERLCDAELLRRPPAPSAMFAAQPST